MTCGDIIPGLNSVIRFAMRYFLISRELSNCLKYNYQVANIYGVQYGFRGFKDYPLIKINSDEVRKIHHDGGSYLGVSSDHDVEPELILDVLKKNKINQLYVVGDLKDHEMIYKIYKEIV